MVITFCKQPEQEHTLILSMAAWWSLPPVTGGTCCCCLLLFWLFSTCGHSIVMSDVVELKERKKYLSFNMAFSYGDRKDLNQFFSSTPSLLLWPNLCAQNVLILNTFCALLHQILTMYVRGNNISKRFLCKLFLLK